MSDAVWLALIAVLAIAVKEVFDQRRAAAAAAAVREVAERAAEAAGEVKTAAENVKETLANSDSENKKVLSNISKGVKDVHILVNAERGALLKLYSASANALAAALEGKPGHDTAVKAAELARINLIEHEAKQAVVDAGPT